MSFYVQLDEEEEDPGSVTSSHANLQSGLDSAKRAVLSANLGAKCRHSTSARLTLV